MGRVGRQSPVAFADGGQRVHPYVATPDGQTLVGIYDGTPIRLALSSDDGQTWRNLPSAPASVPGFNSLLAAPDGTLLATSSRSTLASNPDSNLYRVAPGAATWAVATVLPANTVPQALAWNASGHPTAVWASHAADDRGSSLNLIAHPL
jgi:hypothetical protein